MKISPFTIVIALLSLAVIGALATLLLSPSPSAPESQAANVSSDEAKTTTGRSLVGDESWDSGDSSDSESETDRGGEGGVSLVASGDAVITMSPAQRDAIETTINEAMSTYSAEGVPALKLYLTHPDAAIRTEAIEAMKQIDDPAAAIALRQAAKEEKDSAKRRALLEAADFVELPSLIGAPR
jgi:HEAT repeat protein